MSDADSSFCQVTTDIPASDQLRLKLRVRPDDTLENLYFQINTQLGLTGIQVLLQSSTYSPIGEIESRLMKLENSDKKTLRNAGLAFGLGVVNEIIVRCAEHSAPKKTCDSPFNETTIQTPETPPPPPPPPIFDLNAKPTPKPTDDNNKDFMIDLFLGRSSEEAKTPQKESSAEKPRSPLAIMPAETHSETSTSKGRSVSTATSMDTDVDLDQYRVKNALKLHTPSRTNHKYVGLVNQAMTCYLNSLLQALFMTPEFRNAMYTWEFDGVNETNSIPYQLQKLFLNMQTSAKSAVETTDLTKSFGWDSSEAWQQHDVQELCRVMFDALEHKFKRTKQMDLINQLYQGKMIDYVKCLECNTEKSREDAFLDIPLPVKPFGSTVAYESIEQALHAFVEPERLDGNNQYFCEKCDRKCDAHKGLKFTRFPYILTLHLKRFDFDYQTFHRIKLNDKVTFPQTLNLNSFVKEEYGSKVFSGSHQTRSSGASNGATNVTNNTGGSGSSENGSVESAIKCDDCSTTDSESAIDEENSANNNNNNSSNNNNQVSTNNNPSDSDLLQEDDEGIDVTSTTDTKSTVSLASSAEGGPYIYELFAIMIHSGSASGGHYYAYIKEFETGEWFCFNDQSVTVATQEDINKSFGGTRSYSGGSGFSTNAYMLMFRQCDPQRNVYGLKKHEFPSHIQTLLKRMAEKKEEDRRNKEREDVMVSLRVYFNNSQQKAVKETRVFKELDATLDDVLVEAHEKLAVSLFAPIDRCRLVHVDNKGGNQTILQSFEGVEKVSLHKSLSSILLKNSTKSLELLLETRDEGFEFEPIEEGSIRSQVFVVDLYTEDVNGAIDVRTLPQHTVAAYKATVAKKLRLNSEHMVVALLKSNSCATLLNDDGITVEVEEMVEGSKVFVAMVGSERNAHVVEKLLKIVERFEHILTLYFLLPNTDKEILEKMSIPYYDDSRSRLSHSRVADVAMRRTTSPLDTVLSIDTDLPSADVVDAALRSAPVYTFTLPNNNRPSSVASNQRPITPILQQIPSRFDLPESNSEDSSLSDGDRTLVEDHGSSLARVDLLSTNNSPAFSDAQLSSPESRLINDFAVDDDDDDDDDEDYDLPNTTNKTDAPKPYFRAKLLDDEAAAAASMSTNGSSGSNNSEFGPKVQQQRTLMVLADYSMTLGQLKRELEPFVCVPKKFLKIFRQSPPPETECARLTQQLREFKDGERLVIELGRTLRKGEHKYKVFHMKLSDISQPGFEQLTQVMEFIVCNGAEVGQVKRSIIADLAAIDTKYDISFDACRLRRKCYRTPSDIFTDDQRFGDDIQILDHRELILQELDESSMPYTNAEDKTMFLRRWNPSTYTLSPLQEITVTMKDGSGTSELREIISQVSGIPIERIEYMKKPAGSFMRHNMSLLKIHTEIGWESKPMFSDEDPLQYMSNGEMFFYRDKDDPLKELTPSEKREINNRENGLNGTSSSMYSSPRRERGLKIRIDPSPKKASALDSLN